MALKLVINCETGQEAYVDLTPAESAAIAADASAVLAAQQAADQAVAQAAQQRAADAATLLNSSAVRDTQVHRDAFARLIGVLALTIPLAQDATPADIQPLGAA